MHASPPPFTLRQEFPGWGKEERLGVCQGGEVRAVERKCVKEERGKEERCHCEPSPSMTTSKQLPSGSAATSPHLAKLALS